MIGEYCWHTGTKTKFRVISVDKGSKRVTVSTESTGVRITMGEKDFNQNYKKFIDWNKISAHTSFKCECGIEKTYGNMPKEWHSDWCPKGV